MKKFILLLLGLFFFFARPSFSEAKINIQTNTSSKIEIETQNTVNAVDYAIKNFTSEIKINQDTSLEITESINVFFNNPKHGIFRIIPVIYTSKGKTIRANLKVISVTDEKGNRYPYQKSFYNQSVKLKIGSPEKTITGRHTYIIKYKISKVLLSYPTHEELYWNVTGHKWDTKIEKAQAVVYSPYAPITKAECFAGYFGTQEKHCQVNYKENRAFFSATIPLGYSRDFTLIVALDKNNQLHFPGVIKKILIFFSDNWGYLVAVLPLLIMLSFWYTKGRDIRWTSDNIYYQPENAKTTPVSLFAREHLPTVYSPIKGLTPAQVGTIIDEKVDIQDVIAEIIELARLGYLEIKKIEEKKLLGKKIDYLFIKKEKDPTPLKEYQKFLLDNLFIYSKNQVKLSKLKNHFYNKLQTFKNKLYKNMDEEKFFYGNPEKIRIKWIGIFVFIIFCTIFPLLLFASSTFNKGPFFLLGVITIPTFLITRKMPRRTPKGRALYRQIIGLRWYLDKGKWREEIAEKNLFFEEILPLTICLGLVKKLAKEMAVLGVEPPSYFSGLNTKTFSSDFSYFYRQSKSTLLSAPGGKWSGRSSWSGGSGFSSGGFSGGGFGGGGGGSW